MNKLVMILFFAVCVISAQAFVKRDTETKVDDNMLDKLLKQMQEGANQLNDKLKDTFSPEQLNKGFHDALESVQKALDDIKTKTKDTPKA